jgi:hypothetical protein
MLIASHVPVFKAQTPSTETCQSDCKTDDYTGSVRRDVDPVGRAIADLELAEFDEEAEQR